MGSRVLFGDSLHLLPTLAEASVDCIVTDPPYGLGFMGREWDKHASGTNIAFRVDLWREALRVLKPGGHLLAFGGTRTYHRMAVAIEDAGFEIRDSLHWLYGSGFPKSLDVSRAIDKAAGAEREAIGTKVYGDGKGRPASRNETKHEGYQRPWRDEDPERETRLTAPATAAARQWSGYGTALKPAHEPIVLARKPLSEPTVAANVLRWGTGALNIDACRVKIAKGDDILAKNPHTQGGFGHGDSKVYGDGRGSNYTPADGRFPPNLLLDEAAAEVLDRQSGIRPSGAQDARRSGIGYHGGASGTEGERIKMQGEGGASRFFPVFGWSDADFWPFLYMAKASRSERNAGIDGERGNHHPTVKPIAVMRWLCGLITPPGGTVLDPFAGSGSTGVAAFLEGFESILIEREWEHVELIQQRMAHVTGEGKGLFA